MERNNIIKKLIDLYVITGDKYLVQYPSGIYITVEKGKKYKSNKVMKGLQDWQYNEHLDGKKTLGVFCKVFSKFITFDVDFRDDKMAKWITYKISNTLDEMNIEHHISFSGSKGYHIDIFIEDTISVEHAKKFYEHVLSMSDVQQYFNQGDVEFRPSDKQGVKIPLGYHQKTRNYCGFCLVEDSLKVMSVADSQRYLINIKKIKRQVILDIIGIENDSKYDKKTLMKTEEAISRHRPLPSYNQSEDYSIDLAINMIQNGLQVQGSRNKSLFLIGLYFKYMGMTESECQTELNNWMAWQKPESYTTPLQECYKEIERMVKNMYAKNYNLTANTKDLTVSYDEIKWIIDNCPEKNQKLITYAMLIHSKRHANKQGVFYMPFKDIAMATGIVEKTARSQVNKLIDGNVIDCLARNQKQKGTTIKKANLYRMNVGANLNQTQTEQIESAKVYTTSKRNDIEVCLRFYFTDKQLKSMLPRKQYESLIG